MSQQKVDLQIRGLYTAPNNLSGSPAGALDVADNLVIEAKNLIKSRRGQTQYGSPLPVGSDQVNKLFNYSSSLICNYDSKMAYDSGNGVWIDYSGNYSAPDASFKMRSLEAQRNFYFTTSQGIYKIDTINATPRTSGVGRALGGTGVTTGSTGFLVQDSAVAYRIVWGYQDSNANLLLGPPSQRLIVANPSGSGSDKDVNLTFTIPNFVTTEYFYQIYRSTGTGAATDQPSDELQLVLQGNCTSGEITAKSFTVLDQTPYSLMRATLYTSPSQEGIANENNPPPFAIDMDVYKNCAFYANVKQKQTLSIALISVEFPSLGYEDTTGTLATGTNTITAIPDTTDLRVGMRVINLDDSDAILGTILSIDSSSQVTLAANYTTSSTSGTNIEFQDRFTIGNVDYWASYKNDVATNSFFVDSTSSPGQNINATAENLLQIINTSASNTTIYGYYTSGVEDLPGQILFEERGIGGTAFSATSTFGASFSPILPATGNSILSSNETRLNRVYISKASQVESVPLYRYFDIGSANFPIQRVVALRDGIFFFKQDGIFRISGETFESFVNTLIDNTVILKVPESAVAFNNQVFCFTTQGVCAVTDSGVRIMSVPVENVLLELSSEQFVNFASASFGVAYESARLYMFFTVTKEDDEFATQAFVYNSLTDSWTRWVMDRTCGIVNPTVNKLFMAQADTGQILIERKNYTNSDYADEQYAVVIDSVDSNTQLTLNDASVVQVGMTLVQATRSAYIEDVQGNVLTITSTPGFTTGAATVYTPIENKLRWLPIDVENPGILKQFFECTLMFKDAAFREIEAGFSTNVSTGEQIVPITNYSQGGWGTFPWGQQSWGGDLGGQNTLRTYIPRDKQRASWLMLSLTTNEAFTGFSLQGVSLMFNPMTSRIR